MTDTALTSASTYAQVRVREPIGDRIFGETPTIGGEGANIVVPGARPGAAVQIDRRKGVWIAHPINDSKVRFNGRLSASPRDLRRHDVFAVGDAQIVVTDVSRTLLRLEVCHLAGNATISPAGAVSALAHGDGDEELLIQAPRVASPAELEAAAARQQNAAQAQARAQRAPAARAKPPRAPRTRRFWLLIAAVAVAALAVIGVVSQLNSVALDIEPKDARVHVPGTLLSIHTGGHLLLLPGQHVIRAEHDGYTPAQVSIAVSNNVPASARLRLAKLPGTLRIDTADVAATVNIDGVESGRVPGVITMSPGNHTITLSAPRYVDYIASVVIEGAGVRQDLKAILQPSWGTLQISAIPAGAHVVVDGVDSGMTPTVVDVPSGVRRVRISAPNLKTWESSVVLKAGEALNIGPIILGEPDAHLTLTSVPAGAEVTVGGVHRGQTPIEVDLPAGIQHELVVNSPGYATWTRPLFADPGKRLRLDAKLEAVGARVTIQGEPDGAQLSVDGVDRGRTPQSLELSATEHRIEGRKEGWITYTGTVTPAKGLDRTLQYRLVSDDRSIALAQTASTVYTQTGYLLRLIPAGTFSMGSERREQGRRPNEGLRRVTLKRPLYFGVTEVTNEQFRRFHPDHTSGFIDRHSLDLDDQPVSQVSWNEAAEYSNWLSERDNLPTAYERKNDTYVLKRPVTIGYRLPTEAEWEYAARYASPGQFRRYAWGDALPMTSDVGNLAGAETGNSLPAALPGYRDEYPLVAPVGKFKPTPLGLHDMSGNVSEWIDDYYLSFVDSAPVTDPLGPQDGTRHVIRGANWKSASATDLRLAWRDGADGASTTIGFRVVRYAE
ncbi:MAG TPA: PEGA domain-containing protein [Steroidobacteraceae bacterium]|nr:PEGA domain-containing protein [Steroidobacteraceae bacterium]